jgi:hypothetical protein
MAGQFDDLVGELSPGDHGWLPLDEAGNPTGPATLQPPPPPALACAVRVTAEVPLPEGHDLLVSETGAPLIPPLTSNVDKRDPDTYVAPVKPSIVSLTPNTAVSGDPDLEMLIEGTGFTPTSVIIFAGVEEPTDFHSDTSIGTGVKPSLFAPATCSVEVRDTAGVSNSLDFTFTDPAARGIGQDRRGKTEQGRRDRD